jgi:N-glycosylase/DNA lyase
MIELDMISRNLIQDILLQLPGVGRKVVDCISLFSLDQCSIIPIDTHVWSIVSRDYDTTLKEHKSLTPTVYHKVLVVMML